METSRTGLPLLRMSIQPRIAFIGVRSSWLSVARNSSFSRLWRSASSRACRSLVSRRSRSLRGLALRGDVAADADHLGRRRSSRTTRPRSVIHTTAVGPDGAILALRRCPLSERRLDRGLDARHDRRDEGADDPQLRAERALRKAEQRFGVGRPVHLAGAEVPFPGGDLGDLHRHAAAAPRSRGRPVRTGQRRRALARRAARAPGWPLQRLLRVLALRDLRLQRVVQLGERARLAERVDEHPDLRPQDVRVDRLAQVIDRAGAVAAQDVVVVDQMGGEEQDGTCCVRLRCLISVASSMPLIPGIRMSRTIAAKSCRSSAQQRFVGRLRPHQRCSRCPPSIASSDVEVARLVVDDQHLAASSCMTGRAV